MKMRNTTPITVRNKDGYHRIEPGTELFAVKDLNTHPDLLGLEERHPLRLAWERHNGATMVGWERPEEPIWWFILPYGRGLVSAQEWSRLAAQKATPDNFVALSCSRAAFGDGGHLTVSAANFVGRKLIPAKLKDGTRRARWARLGPDSAVACQRLALTIGRAGALVGYGLREIKKELLREFDRHGVAWPEVIEVCVQERFVQAHPEEHIGLTNACKVLGVQRPWLGFGVEDEAVSAAHLLLRLEGGSGRRVNMLKAA